MVRIRSSQDFGAALVFIVIGTAGLYFGKDLAFGSAAQMGPGYFPSVLSGLILLLGLGLALKSLSLEGPPVERAQLRPIGFIVGGILLFGVLINVIGLALTAVLLTVVVAYARREAKLVESLALGFGLAVFVIAVFVYGLSQPLPVWWGE